MPTVSPQPGIVTSRTFSLGYLRGVPAVSAGRRSRPSRTSSFPLPHRSHQHPTAPLRPRRRQDLTPPTTTPPPAIAAPGAPSTAREPASPVTGERPDGQAVAGTQQERISL